ncbi:TPA: type III secretion system needle length determinant, SpaN/EivJ family [Yersinia enterocolitica]
MDKIANIKIGQQNIATDSTRSISSIIEEKLLKNKKKKTRNIEQIELTAQQIMLPLQTVDVPSTTGAIVYRNYLGNEINTKINQQSLRAENSLHVMTQEAQKSWATARADTKITSSAVDNRQAQDKILSQSIKGDAFNISNNIASLNKEIVFEAANDIAALGKDIGSEVGSDITALAKDTKSEDGSDTAALGEDIESEVQNILQSIIPLIKQTPEQLLGLRNSVDTSATLPENQQHINTGNITDGQDGNPGTLIYRFQQWGENHSVIISEHSEGAMTLKPSDELVEDRLTHALQDNNDASKWQLDQNSQGRNHSRYETNDEEDD